MWFPKMGVTKNGWFLRDILLKWMMTGGTPFLGNRHLSIMVTWTRLQKSATCPEAPPRAAEGLPAPAGAERTDARH